MCTPCTPALPLSPLPHKSEAGREGRRERPPNWRQHQCASASRPKTTTSVKAALFSRQIWKHPKFFGFSDLFRIFGGRLFVFCLLNPNSTKLTLSCAAVVQDWEENIGLELSGFARLGNQRDPHPIGEEIICVESRRRRMGYRSWSEEAPLISSQFSENSQQHSTTADYAWEQKYGPLGRTTDKSWDVYVAQSWKLADWERKWVIRAAMNLWWAILQPFKASKGTCSKGEIKVIIIIIFVIQGIIWTIWDWWLHWR